MIPSSKTAVILGGTPPHIELITKLKTRGYYVVLVDYLGHPPAAEFADSHVQISTLDEQRVYELARDFAADLVLAICVDQANVTAAIVSERLGLATLWNASQLRMIANKVTMKEILLGAGIQTARYVIAREESDLLLIDFPFPMVVKPADSNGSKGVRKVGSKEELASAFTRAREVSRVGVVLVEEFLTGIEFSGEFFINNGCAIGLGVKRKISLLASGDEVLGALGSVSPPNLKGPILSELEEVADSLAHHLHVNDSPLLIQFIVVEGRVVVVEFALRLGGGMSVESVKLRSGVDVTEKVLNKLLGEPTDVQPAFSEKVILTLNLFAHECRFGAIRGLEKLAREGIINSFYKLKRNGDRIGSSLAAQDRVASVIIVASTAEECSSRVRQVFHGVEVMNLEGQDVLHRSNRFFPKMGVNDFDL